jgi:hypothetical protein
MKSSFNYIAFLDADDWYLPNRFIKSKEIFTSDPSVDGVYEATGFYYESTKSLDPDKLTTLKCEAKPETLLFTLLQSECGRFTTDAITLKRSIFEKSGLFEPSLRLHQDTHLWLKLAHVGKLVPGLVKEPVAIRRQHAENRIQFSNKESRRLFHIKLFKWFEKENNVEKKAYRIIFNRYVASLKTSFHKRLFFTLVYLIKNPLALKKLI